MIACLFVAQIAEILTCGMSEEQNPIAIAFPIIFFFCSLSS
ncbi:hypothetical protein [Scytonema sp. NUACC26]